jgi:hypothetical protein
MLEHHDGDGKQESEAPVSEATHGQPEKNLKNPNKGLIGPEDGREPLVKKPSDNETSSEDQLNICHMNFCW